MRLSPSSVRGSHSRLEQAPGDGISRVAAVLDGRQKLRKHRIGRHRRGQILALLVVEPCADVDREVAGLDRVSHESGVGVRSRVGVCGAGDSRRVETVSSPTSRSPGQLVRRIEMRVPVAEPELELVPQIAGVEEGRDVHAGLAFVVHQTPSRETVLPDPVDVEIRLLVEAALRRRRRSAGHGREVERGEELRREHLRVLDLVRPPGASVVPVRWQRSDPDREAIPERICRSS